MEDIDGGLHPAVDGQSLDEDEDEEHLTPNVLPPSICKGTSGDISPEEAGCARACLQGKADVALMKYMVMAVLWLTAAPDSAETDRQTGPHTHTSSRTHT